MPTMTTFFRRQNLNTTFNREGKLGLLCGIGRGGGVGRDLKRSHVHNGVSTFSVTKKSQKMLKFFSWFEIIALDSGFIFGIFLYFLGHFSCCCAE